MAKFSTFVVLSALFSVALCASITLSGTCRDFTPSHPDFESYLGSEHGAIEASLDADSKPILKPVPHATFTNPQRFAEWYRDTDGTNIPITISITLSETVEGSGVYTYQNPSFFPIDGEGFGNFGNSGHNFHFTTEFKTTFTYKGGEIFTFTGDDDVFVFINDQLVIDLGGVHGPESDSVNLDSLGLTLNADYEIFVFQAERHTSGSNFRIDTSIQLVSTVPANDTVIPGRDAYLCEVLYENFCAGEPQVGSRQGGCPADPYIAFEPQGTAYHFDNFNAISFGNFYAPSSDIEGRLAVAGNLNLPNGQFSVGYELHTSGVNALDQPLPFALVVGGNGVWNGGSVHPDGSNFPYPGPKEDIYVGGTFTGTPDLVARRTGGPNPGFVDAAFQNAQAYYTALSDAWANAPQGQQATSFSQWSGLTITCTDASVSAYYVNLVASDISSITYWTKVNCNPEAQFVFNVRGTGQVLFQGDNFPHREEKVVYNINGPSTVKVITEVRGTILAPQAVYNQPGQGVVKGHVIVKDVIRSHQINRLRCATPAPPPHPPNNSSPLCPGFETECDGLNFPLGNNVYSFRDFGVISFDSFTADTGDIEGRAAVKNDFTVGNGYSVGYELQTANNQPDNSLPYAIVAGRDVVFGSGEVYPNGLGDPYPGNAEGIFAGRNFTGPFYLESRRTGGPCTTPGCLNNYFNAAQSCYMDYQDFLAGFDDNVQTEIYWSGLFITCNDISAEKYYVTLNPEQMAQYTYTSTDNCNLQASWVINVVGSGDFEISGDSFPGIPGGVVYNIQGSGRVITVHDTAVTGHILAPQNILNQVSGVIIGKVVAGNVMFSLQINKQNTCPEAGTLTLRTAASAGSNGNSASVYRVGGFREGDQVEVNGQTATISAVYSNPPTLVFSNAMNLNEGDILLVTVSRSIGREAVNGVDVPAEETNSGSIAQAAFALVIAAVALF